MSNRILLGKRYVTSRQGVVKTRCGQVVQGELNVARKVRVTRTDWWRIRSPTREGGNPAHFPSLRTAVSRLVAGCWCRGEGRAGTLGELGRTVPTETRTETVGVRPLSRSSDGEQKVIARDQLIEIDFDR